MTRVCSGCGLHSCSGECFLECPADYPDKEVAALRAEYVPSEEYLAWVGKIDGDPLRHLEPKRKVA